MKRIFYSMMLLAYTFTFISSQSSTNNYDVTLVGFIRFSNGLGRNAMSALDYLHDSLKMNCIMTRPEIFSIEDVPRHVQKIIQDNNKSPGKVAILYDTLDENNHTRVPASKIKLAYSMTEADTLYPKWVSIINNNFDAVVVPDPFLVQVYKNSGVQKPIFVIPIPVYMDQLLAKPLKTKPQYPFVFGISCSLSDNKNHTMLVDAFINEFKNSPHVQLRVHTTSYNDHAKKLEKKLESMKITNVILTAKSLAWPEYIEFMSSLDCYCLVSKGEGFSLTPREAMALGIPCIISNNTSHKTICESGFVYGVKSDILETHRNGDKVCGHNFNCKVENVQIALRLVFQNYNSFLSKAHKGREWVKQYHGNNLKPQYLNLFKPRKVILGNENKVTKDYLMTTDKALYNKYLSL